MSAFRKFPALIFWTYAAAAFSQPAGPGLSISDYIAELDRLAAAVGRGEIQEKIRQLPPRWSVKTNNGIFEIDTRWIREELAQSRAPKLVSVRITELKKEAQAFQKSPQDFSVSKKVFAEILARREFRKVHGPTAWDLYRKKIYEFLLKILGQVLGHSAFPSISTIIVWVLAAAAFITLAFWIFDTMQRSARGVKIEIQGAAISGRDSKDWMTEAKAAAAAGRWRDAVHLSYWAGISFLEGRGLWRPDRTRTPREYLHLVPDSAEYHGPLTALTRRFETIWYGKTEAGPESFNEAIKNLESMGWPTS